MNKIICKKCGYENCKCDEEIVDTKVRCKCDYKLPPAHRLICPRCDKIIYSVYDHCDSRQQEIDSLKLENQKLWELAKEANNIFNGHGNSDYWQEKAKQLINKEKE